MTYLDSAEGMRSLQETTTTTTTTNDIPTSNLQAEQDLRNQLLADYDRQSFPFASYWQQQQQQNASNASGANIPTGVPIQLGLNFHRVLSVDPTSSVVDMIVWVRQQWVDPRLVWDPAAHNGITALHAWIQDGSGTGGETSEIWTPDLVLWNAQEALDETLTDTHAIVSYDGTVFWSRPGHVKPVCKFQGLEDFPFDRLSCTIEVGSWAYSGLYLRPTKLNDGFTIGGSDTAGEAFQEFTLESVSCEEHVYPPYPQAPLEDWPVIFYHVSFQRSWQPYARGFLALQILLNLFAFCAFWLPPHVGERMSLAITAVLAAVASELVVAAKLPAASELTWFAKFSLVSLLFTASALLESTAVIYFHYLTDDDLVPHWYRWMQRQAKKFQTTSTVDNESSRHVNFREPNNDDEPPNSKNNNKNNNHATQPTTEGDAATDEENRVLGNEKKDTNGDGPERNDSRRSVSFENLPESQNGKYRDFSESRLSELSASDASAMGDAARPSLRASLKELSSFRTRKSIKTILGRDADDFKNAKEMENNARWQGVAKRLDETSRLVFPVAFAIFVSVAFAKA